MKRFAASGLTFDVTDVAPADERESGQVAILLHGFPQDRHCWEGVAAALAAAGYRVLAPDQRGYSPGARPGGRSAYTLPRLAADVLALADAAGADRFHLVGHDLGASVAWYLAARHPDRLRSLTCLSVPHPRALLRSLFTSGQSVRSTYLAAFQLPALPEFAFARLGQHRLRTILRRTGLDVDHASRYAERAADPVAVRGPLAWYRAIPLNPRGRTGPIDVPTLFVWSDRDRFVTRAAAARCGRYVRGPYQFAVLAGVSHWLPEEAPERVAAFVLRHLALNRQSPPVAPDVSGRRRPAAS